MPRKPKAPKVRLAHPERLRQGRPGPPGPPGPPGAGAAPTFAVGDCWGGTNLTVSTGNYARMPIVRFWGAQEDGYFAVNTPWIENPVTSPYFDFDQTEGVILFKQAGTYLCSMEARLTAPTDSASGLHASIRRFPDDFTASGYEEESDHGAYTAFNGVVQDGTPCVVLYKVLTVQGDPEGLGVCMHFRNSSGSNRTILADEARLHVWPIATGAVVL